MLSTDESINIAVIARNEEKSIAGVLSDVFFTMRRCGQPYEIFLVDGYSEDDTVKVAERLGIKVTKARGGKGKAVRQALEMATGRYVLFMDADGSHMPNDIICLLDAVRHTQADLVIASRMLGSSEELGRNSPDNLLRLWGNKLSALVVNKRWGCKLTDIQNGFRIIKRQAAQALDLKEEGFSIEQEMVMKCLQKRLKVLEIPGTERKRLYGSSKIRKRKEFWNYLMSFMRNL